MKAHTKILLSSLSALLLVAAPALATTDGYSIGLNLGADEYPTDPPESPAPGELLPSDVAGAPGAQQANWNNLVGASGVFDPVTADQNGSAVATATYVDWLANNTWASTGRGDDNFFDPDSADFKLLTGYLDTTTTSTNSIFVLGLPTQLTSGYDVYIYFLGTANRGGGYRVLDYNTFEVLGRTLLGTIAPDTTDYVRDLGLDHNDAGNYVVIRGLTAPDIIIESTCNDGLGFGGTFRAPINAVQIVAASLDRTPPSAPANLQSGIVGARLVELSWDASTDANGLILGYEVLRNGTVIATTAATQYRDLTAPPETALTYTVRALDDSYNTSNPSTALAVTTEAEAEAVAVIKDELYEGIATDGLLDTLRADPTYPDSPTSILYRMGTEGPAGYADNYGSRLTGWITPAESGNYVFYLSSDDQSELYLSTDDTPANLKKIAFEPEWNNARQWVLADRRGVDGVPLENRSDTYADTEWTTGNTISLQAGTKYMFMVEHAEGGGGDNVGFTYAKAGVTVNNGDAPLLTEEVTALVDAAGASVTITQQPQATTQTEGIPATFTVAADITSPWVTAAGYQWYRDGQPIVNARNASYTTPELDIAADDGALFKCLVVVPGAHVYSDEVALTVVDDTIPPKVTKIVAAGVSAINVNFDEPVEQTSAEDIGNYSLSGGVTISSGTQINATTVRLITSVLTSEAQYTLTVGGVEDRFGNAIPAGTEYAFVARILGYRDIILADEPVAYFRFQEASGTVAVNDGTLKPTAGDGRYVTGDVPNEVEQQAKTAEGPRPPDFFGFDPVNRAALFEANANDWIDTQYQYLQNLGAFSLEYWVKPSGGRDQDPSLWPGRVGIVGQNDAIEYGFIDPTTIQIWTPGGGALDTTYTFADDEWHHVATIASGTDIRNYFDGELVGTGGAATDDYGGSTYNVHIGGGGVFDVTGNWFIGQIDEVAIFDKAIPAERIAAHYQAALGNFILPEPDEPEFTGITSDGTTLTLDWTGDNATLEVATEADGTYAPVDPPATGNTYQVDLVPGENRYYRLSTQ